jgi:hypothetical protein
MRVARTRDHEALEEGVRCSSCRNDLVIGPMRMCSAAWLSREVTNRKMFEVVSHKICIDMWPRSSAPKKQRGCPRPAEKL